MRAEITHLPMFDEYAFIEQHGQELTSDELEVLSERIDNLDRHIIAFNDAAMTCCTALFLIEPSKRVASWRPTSLNYLLECSGTCTGLAKRSQNARPTRHRQG